MPAYCAARSYIGLVFIISFQTALRMLVQIIILSRLFQTLYRVRGQY